MRESAHRERVAEWGGGAEYGCYGRLLVPVLDNLIEYIMQIVAIFVVQTAIKFAYYACIVAILSPVKQGKQLPCVRM